MSFYSLLGYRSFKTEMEIKRIVLEYIRENRMDTQTTPSGMKYVIPMDDFVNTHVLKIFQTVKQQTWLVSTKDYVFCLLDDIDVDIEKDFQLIKWYVPIQDIKNKIEFRESTNRPEKFGLIDFGPKHKDWYYSKPLLNGKEMAEKFVNNLIVSGSTS